MSPTNGMMPIAMSTIVLNVIRARTTVGIRKSAASEMR